MTRYEEWSGETWYLTSDHAPTQRSIVVIDSVPAPKKRKKGEPKPVKVPFGFARELPKKKKRSRS